MCSFIYTLVFEYTGMYIQVHVYMCVPACGSQKLMLSAFLPALHFSF